MSENLLENHLETPLENLWQKTLVCSLEENYRLSIGALELFVTYLPNEWQFHHRYVTDDESKSERKVALSPIKNLPKDNAELTRFIQTNDQHELKFHPRLANRSIVAKPHSPVFLPPKQSVTIFISTPIWLAIHVDGQEQALLELATFHLPDTWFGPKPHIGELCYASRFSGRTNLDSLPRRAGRIITPVCIKNNAADNLKLEKISIPSEYLSIYMTENGELWTPTLSVFREVDQKKTVVRIDKALHPVLEKATLISKPRVSDPSGLMSKTIDTLFS